MKLKQMDEKLKNCEIQTEFQVCPICLCYYIMQNDKGEKELSDNFNLLERPIEDFVLLRGSCELYKVWIAIIPTINAYESTFYLFDIYRTDCTRLALLANHLYSTCFCDRSRSLLLNFLLCCTLWKWAYCTYWHVLEENLINFKHVYDVS